MKWIIPLFIGAWFQCIWQQAHIERRIESLEQRVEILERMMVNSAAEELQK